MNKEPGQDLDAQLQAAWQRRDVKTIISLTQQKYERTPGRPRVRAERSNNGQ